MAKVKKFHKKKKQKRAFTLVELLAVIVILGLLFALTVPAVSRYINETREKNYSLHEADMKTAASNLMSECVQKNDPMCLPEDGETKVVYLDELVEKKYSEKIKDPDDTDKFCDMENSYVVVSNSSNNVVELDYQVCLVCSNYKSEACDTIDTGPTCDPASDTDAPTCDNIVGASTIWTNKDRVISVDCKDNGCGCKRETFYQTYTETAKTEEFIVEDETGKTGTCEVNVYIDKVAPTCRVEVVSYGSLGVGGWYGGTAPIIKITTMDDNLSGIATYGIGTSKNNPDFNKDKEYEVNPGVSMVYGYVKDEAGNVGTCSIEVKYDNVKPTGEVTYGYEVYNNVDSYLGVKNNSAITFDSKTSEYGDLVGLKVTLSSNSGGMTTTLKNGSSTLASRTISSGVTEMLYTFSANTYNSLVLDMGSSGNANLVEKIELITEHTRSSGDDFYTNKDVSVYVSSQDSFSGKAKYSFDGGNSWQTSNMKIFDKNSAVSVLTQDSSGNNSDEITGNINNIDKLNPINASFSPNGGNIYKVNVGNTTTALNATITSNDATANASYSKSDIRSVSYAWTLNTTQPTSWTTTSSGSSITRNGTPGNNYLWIKTVDRAGNVTINRSSDFNVGYQVIYDCNGGSGCPAEQRKGKDLALTLTNNAPVPTRSGYEFLGWTTTSSAHRTDYAAAGLYSNNAPVRLYAIWRKNLPFTFVANGATLSRSSSGCYIYNAETSCDLTLPTITREGFTIHGFSRAYNGTFNESGWISGGTVTVDEKTATKWYAITSKDMDLTFDANGATISKVSASCTIRNSATTCDIVLPKITRSGFDVLGFASSSTSSSAASGWTSEATVSVNKDTALTWYAITAKGITVTFVANGATIGSTSQSCTIRNNNTTCSVTSPTISRTGFTVVGWNTSSGCTTSQWDAGKSKSFSSDAKYYAITNKGITITFNGNGATSGSASQSCTIWNNTSSCSVTSPTISRTGFSIVGWNTDSGATTSQWTQNTAGSVSSNATYYAITSKAVTITFNGNGNTISKTSGSCTIWNNKSSCSVTSPTITAPSNTPTVIGFNTSSSGTSNQWTHNTAGSVSSDATYYAITKKDGYSLTASYNGNGGTGSTASNSCNVATVYNGNAQGSSCSLALASNGFSKSGYKFKGWSTNSSASSGSSAGTTVSISGNTTYYATWEQEVTLKSVCQTYSGSDLFGKSKGSISGNYGEWHGSLSYDYTCHANSTTCTRSNGYERICVTDACGPYKGKTAKWMKDNSSYCEDLSRFWCSCNHTGAF